MAEFALAGRIFTPRLWPTLCAVAMVAVTLGLGVWQVQRAEWKAVLIAEWQAQANKPALDELPDAGKASRVTFATVKLLGKYQHNKSIHIVPRAYQGKTGFELITPLKMLSGETVLVDRGFVADDSREAMDLPIGTVFANGEMRPIPAQGWMQPANRPQTDEWYWLDPAALATAKQLDTPYPLMLVAEGKALKNMWPVPHPLEMPYSNNHLTYAFIWFSLALAAGVIYFISQSRRT